MHGIYSTHVETYAITDRPDQAMDGVSLATSATGRMTDRAEDVQCLVNRNQADTDRTVISTCRVINQKKETCLNMFS